MTYERYSHARWVREFDLLRNRVAVINQLSGCHYDFARDNPCEIVYSCAAYEVRYEGVLVCRIGRYEQLDMVNALLVVDAWANCVWAIRRAGNLKVMI